MPTIAVDKTDGIVVSYIPDSQLLCQLSKATQSMQLVQVTLSDGSVLRLSMQFALHMVLCTNTVHRTGKRCCKVSPFPVVSAVSSSAVLSQGTVAVSRGILNDGLVHAAVPFRGVPWSCYHNRQVLCNQCCSARRWQQRSTRTSCPRAVCQHLQGGETSDGGCYAQRCMSIRLLGCMTGFTRKLVTEAVTYSGA